MTAVNPIMAQQRTALLFFLALLFIIFHIFGCFKLYDITNDEGAWLWDARNLVKFGHTSLERSHYDTALSPLNTFLHIPLFRAVGPSIWPGRAVSVLFGFFTVALFFAVVRRLLGFNTALISTTLVVFNGMYNKLSCLAIIEPKLYFFMIASLAMLVLDDRRLRALAFIPYAFCLGFKLTALPYLIPVCYLLFDREPIIKAIAKNRMFFIGLIPLAGIFYYCAYRLDPDMFMVGYLYHMDERFALHPGKAVQFFKALSDFAYHTPIASSLFFISFIYAVLKKQKSRIEIFCLLWVLSTVIFLLPQNEISERYLVELVFPLSLLSGGFILALFTDPVSKLKRAAGIVLFAAVIITEVAGSLCMFLVIKPDRPGIETAEWLKNNYPNEQAILAPMQLAVDYPGKVFATSYINDLKTILAEQIGIIKFPCVLIMQNEHAMVFDEDLIMLKEYALPIAVKGKYYIYKLDDEKRKDL